MFNYSSLPTAEPLVIPSGVYKATPAADASEQTSNFKDKSGNVKTYWALPLDLVNEKGEEFTYTWCFSAKNTLFTRYLEIMGGYVQPSGKVKPPLDNAPKTFMIELGKKLNKEGTRQINEVLRVFTDNSKAVAEKELASKAADAEIEDTIPF